MEYLQMSSGTKDALPEQGISNVTDLIHFIGNQGYSALECHRPLDALNTLAPVSSPVGPDWYAYWEARGFEFHEMWLTCHELEEFDKNTLVCAITRDSFGSGGAMLARAGFHKLGVLAEGLRSGIGDVAGMDGKKRADFSAGLLTWYTASERGSFVLDHLLRDFRSSSTVITGLGTP